MDIPRVQYVTTSDGVDIAYSVSGEGPAVVYLQGPPFSHVEREWEVPNYRAYNETLAHRRRLVKLDSRGTGMSQRGLATLTIEGLAADLVAVVDRLELERFAIFAVQAGGLIAIQAARSMPDRVSHLAFMDAYSNGTQYADIPQVAGFLALGRSDWELFAESIAHYFFGWDAGRPARQYAEFLRQCVDQQDGISFFEHIFSLDLTDQLPRLEMPTLVTHHRRSVVPGLETSRLFASRIPNAELLLLNGYWNDPADDYEVVDAALSRLLGQDPPPPLDLSWRRPVDAPPSGTTAAGLVTILFTDIEGSTTLTQRLGDAAAQEIVRAHNEIVREAIGAWSGREIKHTGDGIMASFPLASSALEAAVAIQRGVAAHEPDESTTQLRVRVGLNAGEPVVEGSDLFGTAVQLARRVCDAGEPGSVMVTDVVRQLVAGKGFLFADTGDVALKGFEDPVRLFVVSWEE
jgi:class 3 adenylate cyclase/pimeloyl-ACP methyl ester carboxylesterase